MNGSADVGVRRQLHFDLNVARNQNAKLKEELRLREEECKRLLKDAQEAAAKAKSERTRLLKERDAAQSERNDLKRRDAQLTHQSRKLEQEHDKLKNRLLSLLGKSDSRSVPAHARQGIDATAPLRGKAPSSIPGRVGQSSAATQFVNSKVVRGHEEREGALLAENANLRQALALLSQELMDTINGCDAANRHGQPLAQSMSHVLQTDDADAEGWHRQLEMPFDIVQSDIQLALRGESGLETQTHTHTHTHNDTLDQMQTSYMPCASVFSSRIPWRRVGVLQGRRKM